MSSVPAGFPVDWLEAQGRAPATDLDLVVLLVNTHDLLEDPPDRLGDVAWLQSAFSQVGHAALAEQLRMGDLDDLLALRQVLRLAFEATDVPTAADALNPQLKSAGAVHQLVPETPARGMTSERARFVAGHDRSGFDAMAIRLPVALAEHIAAHGVRRLGVCNSDPCRCAFVDRTRAATRRYCCSYCNDRHAARAYRARRRS
jgi:predicted RNA-binding Zn ribbon-like protein